MPEQYPKNRPPNESWTLSRAHDVAQIVGVRCGHCPGKRFYYPADLIQLLGNVECFHLETLMSCERCHRGDEISARVFIPLAERQKMKLRRLVAIKIKRVPVWRDE
jgi:predicted metal-binding protein